MPSTVRLLLETAKADTDLLMAKDSHGDVFTIPRQVDFLFRAPTAEKAKLVASFINDNRYGEATASSDDHGHRVQVLITMPITQNVICSVSGLMACISKLFEIDYDGWGSVTQIGK